MLLTHFLAEHNKILTGSEVFGYSYTKSLPNEYRHVINEGIH